MASRALRLSGQDLPALPGDVTKLGGLQELYAGGNRQAYWCFIEALERKVSALNPST